MILLKKKRKGTIVISGSYDITDVVKDNPDNTHGVINNQNDHRTEEYENMCYGGTSEIENNLSQLSQSYREDNISNENKQVDCYYKDGMPAYEEMTRTCPNQAMFEECLKWMRNQTMKHIISKGNISNSSHPKVLSYLKIIQQTRRK